MTHLRVVGICLVLLAAACGEPSPAPAERAAGGEPAAVSPTPEAGVEAMPAELTADSSDEEIAAHMLATRRAGRTTRALADLFPDLTRERAYAIQQATLAAQGELSQVGWKIGWSRVLDPRTPTDPIFGYVLDSDVFQSGDSVPASRLVGGSAGIEAEVVVWVDRDLPGPSYRRADIEAVVTRIAPAIELVSSRLPAPNSHDQAIADDVYHAGVVLGDPLDLAGVDLSNAQGHVAINAEDRGQGTTGSIMGRDPIEAVVWLANELPKYGRHLRAGDFVLTGTVLSPPAASAGDHATVTFATLGTVEVEIAR